MFLIIAGLILFAYSFIMLASTEKAVQYMFPMPKTAPESEVSAAAELLESWNELSGEMSGAPCALSAQKYDEMLSTEEKSCDDVLVTFAGEGYFSAREAYLKEGRLFTDADYRTGGKLIIIDEDIAFTLFGNEPAEGMELNFYGETFIVAGVTRAKDTPGDHNSHSAWITYKCADSLRIEGDYALLEAKREGAGVARSLSAVGEELSPGGTFIDLTKEAMRAGMIARITFIVLAVAALITLVNRWTQNTIDMVKGFFEEVKRRYFRSMLPKVAAMSLLHLFVYALLIGGCFGVLYLLIEPMFVFTEWIPKVFVDPEDIKSVYTELTRGFSYPVVYRTAEYAAVRFYGALARWGTVIPLTGCAVCALKAVLTRWEEDER